jgi:hypothetical protein
VNATPDSLGTLAEISVTVARFFDPVFMFGNRNVLQLAISDRVFSILIDRSLIFRSVPLHTLPPYGPDTNCSRAPAASAWGLCPFGQALT